jgi:hypothetical protein
MFLNEKKKEYLIILYIKFLYLGYNSDSIFN